MMVGAYANLHGALLNLMEALVAAYIGKVSALNQDRCFPFIWGKKR